MSRRLAAFFLVALAAFAAPSRAAFTTHFDAMTADVDARLAAFPTGKLTKPQKLDKAHLTALRKTLHKKSTTLKTDLAVAVAAAKLVVKNFPADATIPGELGTTLDGFYADVLAEYDAVAQRLGQPQKDTTQKLIDAFNKAGPKVDAIQAAADAYLKAKAEQQADAAVQSVAKKLPCPKVTVLGAPVNLGPINSIGFAKPQTLTITNETQGDASVTIGAFKRPTGGFFVELPLGATIGQAYHLPAGRHIDVVVGYSGNPGSKVSDSFEIDAGPNCGSTIRCSAGP